MLDTDLIARCSTTIGYLGAATVAVASLLNQAGLLRSEDWRFPGLNLIGSGMIAVSLIYNFNAPSLAVEMFWSSISLYGLWRNLRARTVKPPT